MAITTKLEQQSRFNGARALKSCPRSFPRDVHAPKFPHGLELPIIVQFQRSLQHSGGRPPVWALMNLPSLFKRQSSDRTVAPIQHF